MDTNNHQQFPNYDIWHGAWLQVKRERENEYILKRMINQARSEYLELKEEADYWNHYEEYWGLPRSAQLIENEEEVSGTDSSLWEDLSSVGVMALLLGVYGVVMLGIAMMIEAFPTLSLVAIIIAGVYLIQER